MRMKIDKYDKQIIYELDTNARLPIATLAKRVGLPKETVNYRLKRLLGNRCIKNFYAIINASRFGYRYYRISMKFHRMTPELEEEVIKYIRSVPSCANLRVTEGPFDINFIAIHRTSEGLKSFLEEFSSRFGAYVVEKTLHKIITSYKLNQKMLFGGDKIKKAFNHAEPNPDQIDALDLRILKVLSNEARMKLIELANTLQEDPRVVAYHIKKLEEKGVIVGYSTALNFELFRLQFIQLDINLKHHGKIARIIDFFDETNTCIFAYELLGSQDLSLELYVQNDDHLRNILHMFKQNFSEEFNSYNVSRIYEEYMSNWAPFEP